MQSAESDERPEIAWVADATQDLRAVLTDVRLTWDFGMAPGRAATHVLSVESGRFSLLFQVDRDTLIERGAAYERFTRSVIEAVEQHFSPKQARAQ